MFYVYVLMLNITYIQGVRGGASWEVVFCTTYVINKLSVLPMCLEAKQLVLSLHA